MSIVVVGSVAYDSIKTPLGAAERALGGSASYFSLAASFFTRVSIVAAIGEDFEPAHIELFESRGIDVAGLVRRPGDTFHWTGEYGTDMNIAHTIDTRLGVFADFRPVLTGAQADSPFVFLANIDPDVQSAVLDQVRSPRLVAMDTMNFWINGKRDALARVLARAGMLFLNEEEARLLANARNVMRAARHIREMGPETVAVKRGEYGSLIVHETGMFAAPAYPLEEVLDPTGAGDSFAGGFLGYLASCDELTPREVRNAAIYGSTVASFACEAFSVDRLAGLTRKDIDDRFEFFRELTQF
ncbi:sugar kinase [bacterium]|nr:sugar kinase [bacterium]